MVPTVTVLLSRWLRCLVGSGGQVKDRMISFLAALRVRWVGDILWLADLKRIQRIVTDERVQDQVIQGRS